jgi:hypothetical protein
MSIEKPSHLEPEDHDSRKTLYHGTKKTFDKFETPTGREEVDVTKGGVVYLTSDIEVAKKYAGPNGYVCVAEVAEPISYKEQRRKQGLPKKKGKYTRDIYIALPIDVEIKEFLRVRDMEK